MPKNRLLSGDYDILIWKENDRAIASFNTMNEIQEKRQMIIEVVGKWIEATTESYLPAFMGFKPPSMKYRGCIYI